MNEKRICPVLYGNWLSFQGSVQDQNQSDIECFDRCAWWDEERKQCAILSISQKANNGKQS